MRNLKKLASVVLAAVMTLALAVPAFAAQDPKYKITIENPVVGETYNFYKIFDLTISGTNYDYTATSAWVPFFAPAGEGTEASAGNAFLSDTATDSAVSIGGESKYLNLTNENVVAFANAATAFAKTLTPNASKEIAEGDLSTEEGKEGQYTQDFASAGYYLVFAAGATQTTEASDGSVCILTNTNPEQAIKIKSDKPSITKTAKVGDEQVNTLSVGIGDDVSFTITGTVPNTSGYETYTYKITDTMGAGLTFTDEQFAAMTIKTVAEDGTKTDVDASNIISKDKTDDGFVISLNVMNMQALVGQTIEVTYTATVNGNALNATNSVTNSATLTYEGGEKPPVTPPTTVTVYLAKIDVLKHNSANEKLENAKFVLQNDEDKYYKYTAVDGTNPANVEWVDEQTNATVLTTNSEGQFDTAFVGLGAGTYTLIETEAPTGYNKLADGITVTITPYVDPNADKTEPGEQTPDSDKVPAITAPDGTVTKIFYKNAVNHTEDVVNLTGAELPETGGMGTTLFYAVGGLLVVSAGVLLIVKKRMGAE